MSGVSVKDFLSGLTEKQLDVVSCLMFGLSYKSIGRTLHISDRTVEKHVHEIVQKADVSTKDEIVKRLHLPENSAYYRELEQRYNNCVSHMNFESPKRNKGVVYWKIYTTASVVMLLLAITAQYYQMSPPEAVLQSVGNSTYLLKRGSIIKQMMSSKSHAMILEGQGGAGKTTLAREYTKKMSRSIKYEINAESKGSIKSELVGLAGILAKSSNDIETKNIIGSISDENEKFRRLSIFLHRRLKEEKDWCLLLDNLDDPNIISSVYLNNIFNLDNGTIVITTRNKNLQSYFHDAEAIQVGRLSEKEKRKLFCKITGLSSSKIIEENLLEIPSYPLDVSCCAYYVKNTGISLPAYVQKMNKMDQEFWSGNRKILSDNASYNESRYSIIASSIENILHQNKDFLKALFTISILDSQKIPIDLFSKIVGEKTADQTIYNFQKYGLIEIDDGNNFSTHRVTQTIMRHYCLQYIPKDTLNKLISDICSIVCENRDDEYMITHLKSIISNLEENLSVQNRIKIQVSLVHLIRQYGRSPVGAIKYIKEIVKNGKSVLDPYKMVELQLEGAKLCISADKNKEALEFLKNDIENLPFKQEYLFSYINYYTLWGILYMRSRCPEKANFDFDKAIKLLEKIKDDSDRRKITEAAIYSEKGISCIMCYIYLHKRYEVIKLMKYAINLIKDIDSPEANEVLTNIKIRLATMYNSLGMHDEALQMCEESECLLDKMERRNNDYYSTRGLLYLDRGHALLRKNNLKRARYYLLSAKELFEKLMKYEYSSRVRVQEAEALTRDGEYKAAYQDCLDIITSGKTDNDFNEMFLNRAHYIAGDIQYKCRHYQQALKHFRDFAVGSKMFCRHFLSDAQYNELKNMHAFDVITDEKNIKTYFKNAVEIFKRVCCKNSKFVTDYAQKNFDEAR